MIPKFRAFLKSTKDIRKVLVIDYLNRMVDLEGGEIEQYFEDVILMQSTGLKDKNGVEIYVGDIVKGEQWLTTTMPAQIVDQVSYSERNTMFYLGGANESHDRFMHSLGNTIYQYEVVGNIYANPELLSNP